jgi:hypothetical protein
MKKLKLSIQFSAFLFWVSVLAALMLFVLPTIGCSAVQEIGTQSQTIDKLSQSSEERFVTIADISEVEEVDEQAEHGIIEQRKIQNSVSEIRQALPRVEDKSPNWMILMGRVSIAVILIATTFIIWQTGIGTLIRHLLYSVTFFIPRRSRRDAEMDLKIADEQDDMTIREVIASKRSSDPAYDAAYKKLKQKRGN